MAYQFHLMNTRDGTRYSVIHGVTLDGYSTRAFSVWLDESGNMTDAESRHFSRLALWRQVTRGGNQWRLLAERARHIWAASVPHEPEYKAARVALRFLQSIAGV
jgi:hypothetical protein